MANIDRCDLYDVITRGPRSVTGGGNHLKEHVTLLRIKFLCCGNSLREFPVNPRDVLKTLPQTLNVSARTFKCKCDSRFY